MIVDVEFQERYWYPDDGGEVWVSGYQPVDAEGRFIGRDSPLLAAQIEQGVQFQSVLGGAEVGPGEQCHAQVDGG